MFVDGTFALGLFEDVVLALGLRVGQAITPQRLDEIARAETVRRAKEDAYRLLGFRGRSEKEIIDRLARKNYDQAVVGEVLETLRAHGFVDDEAFARAWVRERGAARGRRALESELREKGIANEVAARTLDEAKTSQTEQEAARAALARKLGASGRPVDDSRPTKAKLAAFLQRRGFGWDVVRTALAEVYGRGDADLPLEENG